MNFAIFSAEHVECLKCWVCMASSDEAESSCWSESRLSGNQVCSTEEFEAMVKPHGCLHPFFITIRSPIIRQNILMQNIFS